MKNISGKRYGRLVAVEPMKQDSRGNWWWKCICDCGTETTVKFARLSKGTTKSCGCLARDIASLTATTHGMSRTPTYNSWMCMKRRCLDAKNCNYANYGGRGIKFCERWKKFENFLADMGERPPGTTLDRIDHDGHYIPENCRWADQATQHRNTRLNVHLTYGGRTQCLAAWADELGIRRNTLQKRIANGWSVYSALGTL